MRLLLLEDDATLGEALSGFLRLEGHVVDWFQRLGDARAVMGEPFDVLLIDWQLPDGSGVDWVRQLRAQGRTMPIFVLTARDLLQDRIHGLDSGADDYLVKPFEIRELVARIKVLVRRQSADKAAEIHCGDLVYDSNTRQFAVAGVTLALPAREHDVLEVLMLKQGKTVSKTALMKGVFSLSEEPSADAIEIYISRLRKKLEHSSAAIMTLRGLGYLLKQKDD